MTRSSLRKNIPMNLSNNTINHENQANYNEMLTLTANKTTSPSMIEDKKKQFLSPTINSSSSYDKNDRLNIGKKRRFRYHVALLGLTCAVVNCYAQATFCIAIVEMVLPADYIFKGESGSQAIKVVPSQLLQDNSTNSFVMNDIDPLELENNSCPVEYKYKDYYDEWRFPNTSSKSPTLASRGTNSHLIDVSNRFDWDASRQGLLLGAFAIGTAPLQILGGRLAEIYGAKWVLLAGCIGTAVTNLTIPLLAHFSFTLLVVNRVTMGIAQAGMEPGLMCLMAQWLAPSETGFFISMLLFALCIGFFLGSLLSSFLLTLGLGWAITYYFAGGLNLIMSLIWYFNASTRPEESKFISEEELEYIKYEQGKETSRADGIQCTSKKGNNDLNHEEKCIVKEKHTTNLNCDISTSSSSSSSSSSSIESSGRKEAPWLNILKTPSVWAFIICKISVRWCADVLAIELPTYLANVLHLSIKLNGILNSASSAFFAIFSFITGYFVNELLKHTHEGSNQLRPEGEGQQEARYKSYMSKTTLRKLFQSVASFGSAIAIYLMTRYDCNIILSMSMMFVLSACLMMGTGGELQIPYDMTTRYPGTLHGMACTLSVSGWLAPPLIGLILGDQPSSRQRWSIVWYLTASINLIGGLVFVLFADASPRNFEKRSTPMGEPKSGGRRQVSKKDTSMLQGSESGLGTRVQLQQRRDQTLRSTIPGANITTSATTNNGADQVRPLARPQGMFSWRQRPTKGGDELGPFYFDGELLRIRQLEGSLLSSNSRLDSLLPGNLTDVMLPYQQPIETTIRHNSESDDKGSMTRGSTIWPFVYLKTKRTKRKQYANSNGLISSNRRKSVQSSQSTRFQSSKIMTRL